jgi:hypothetical protein
MWTDFLETIDRDGRFFVFELYSEACVWTSSEGCLQRSDGKPMPQCVAKNSLTLFMSSQTSRFFEGSRRR